MQSNSSAMGMPTNPLGWLRNLPFDLTLILGVAGLALCSGIVVIASPNLFPTVLFLDLWLLGFHHVIATFTRLSFDKESFHQHRFLVIWLPFIVVVVVVLVVLAIGPWVMATTYLYWQWFHYTRQSYGIARTYHVKADPKAPNYDQWIMYFLPLWGILYRSYQNPGVFLGMELKCLPVPFFVVQIAGVLAVISVVFWIVQQMREALRGQFHLAYVLYMTTHMLIFGVGYLLIKEINYGWLVLNVWHNGQYLLFVWMYNNKRFKGGIDPQHRFLSWMSQTKNQFFYYSICLAISTVFYFTTSKLLGLVVVSSLPLIVVFYQTVNFHHYIVDALIWKVRKKAVSENLGII